MLKYPRQWRLPVSVSLIVAIVFAIAACGSSAKSSATISGTIRFVGDTPIQGPMTAAIKQFEKENPRVHVNAQFVAPGQTYIQALTTQIQGGNAPDVFYTDAGQSSNGSASLLPLAKAGKLLNLAGQTWSGEVPKQAHKLYWIGKKLYGLPLYESPLAIEYNVGEFQKLGLTVPRTFNQFIGLCTKIKAAGLVPLPIPGQAGLLLPLESAASTVYSGDPNWNAQRAAGKVTFAGTKGWQDALQQVVQMNQAGCFQPGAAGTSIAAAFQMVASGQGLMFGGPVDALGAIEGAAHGAKFAAFPLPGYTATSTRAMVTYSDTLVVSKKTQNKAAAVAFVNFIASPAEAKALAKATGTISLVQAESGKLPSALQAFAPFYKANKLVSYAPDGWPTGTPLYAGLYGAGAGILTGQQTPAGILTIMDQNWGK